MGKNIAIICEFNPLHNGHKAILSRARELGGTVVAIMSGNFTQRSIPSVYDKYKRAEAALRCGADAVFELPFPWCSGGAEFFALGAVNIATSLGLTDFIFGSETGELSHVERAAELLDSRELTDVLADEAPKELGAAAAYDKALQKYGISLGSNDKLAVEYLRAARRIGEDARFTAYKRMTDQSVYRSASDLRSMLELGEDVTFFVPEEVRELYKETDLWHGKFEEILFEYFRMCRETPRGIFDADGGVTERLMRAAANAERAECFFSLADTKKYTSSRLRRAALFSYLGVDREAVSSRPEFTVLLALNERGRAFLSEVRKTKSIEVLVKPSAPQMLSERGALQYELWKRADELYALCMRRGVKRGEFLRRSPTVIADL